MQSHATQVSEPISSFFRVLRNKMPASRPACWRYIKRFGETITIKTSQGLLTVRTHDQAIGRSLYVEGQYELELTRKVMQLLESLGYGANGKGRTLIDVGANIGVISIGLMRDGFITRAVAIEPEPLNFSLLKENIALNGYEERIRTYQNALSANEGKVEFEISKDNFGDHRIRSQNGGGVAVSRFKESERSAITVPCLTLDQIASTMNETEIGDCALLWVDVQGYEGRVFEGGGAFLKGGIPTVAEIWPYGILRSGMSLQQFAQIVAGYWNEYWVLRKRGFVRYPIDTFFQFFDELGEEGEYDNVVFTKISKFRKP